MPVQPKGGKKGRKHGRKGRKPAQQRYVSSKRLEKRKIRNLQRHCGMTYEQAYRRWHGVNAT